MKLSRAIGIACLAGLVSICLVVFGGTLWNREPAYHTKPFSYWLDQIPCTVTMPSGFVSRMYPQGYKTAAELEAHAQQDRDRANEGLQAVTAIGDKCLPMLLQRIKCKDSRLKLFLERWSTHLHLTARRFPSDDTMRGQALTAILQLDSGAKPLLPALISLAQDTDPSIRSAARHAVRELSPKDFRRLQQLQQAGATNTPAK